MFNLKSDTDDFPEQKKEFGNSNNFNASREEVFKKNTVISPQIILPGLERLCKTFI